MHRFATTIAITGVLLSGTVRAEGPKLDTDDQKTLYTLGLALSGNLAQFRLSEEELLTVQQGLSDGALAKKPQTDLDTYRSRFQAFAESRRAQAAEATKEPKGLSGQTNDPKVPKKPPQE